MVHAQKSIKLAHYHMSPYYIIKFMSDYVYGVDKKPDLLESYTSYL
jgi:hypothetical protein